MKIYLFEAPRPYKGHAGEIHLVFFKNCLLRQNKFLNLLTSFKDSRDSKCSGSISKESVSEASRLLSHFLKSRDTGSEDHDRTRLAQELQPTPWQSPPDQ